MPVMMTSRRRTANLLFNVIRIGTPETNTPKKGSSKFRRLTRYYPIPIGARNTISSVMRLSATTVQWLADSTSILVLKISLATLWRVFRWRRGPRRGQTRGEDLRYNLSLGFEEAVAGVEKKIKIPRHGPCEACHGTGAKAGTSPQTCPTCRGRGQVSFQQGFFSVSRSCNQCHGQGSIINDPCAACGGLGRTRKMHTLSVKIPAGVDNGSRLKLRGEGESAAAGGAAGDLYVVIQVETHPIFRRENLDILCDVPISFVQAALGAEIDVPTSDGKVKMKIPAGTQSGKLFRIKGKGVKDVHGYDQGDQHVRVLVETPTHLTARQKELLKEFASSGGEDINPIGKGFLDKVKQLFD